MLFSVFSVFFIIMYVLICFGVELVKVNGLYDVTMSEYITYTLQNDKFEVNFKSKIPLACRICDMNLRGFLFKTLLCIGVVLLKSVPQFYLGSFITYLIFKMTKVLGE